MRVPSVFVLLVAAVFVAACDRPGEVPAVTTPSLQPPTNLCAELDGDWDASQETCRLTGTGDQGVTMKISAKYPAALLGDATVGPVLSGYVREFVDKFRHPKVSMAGWEGHEGSASTSYRRLEHAPATTSVVFAEDWFVPGMAHPNAALRTFTFDLGQHKQLQLGDLFCDGVDPVKALASLARPYVENELKDKGFGSTFPVERFEPGGLGSLADDYQAWALDGDALVLYMPSGRGPGGLPPGSVTARVPLTALRGILRDGGCSV